MPGDYDVVVAGLGAMGSAVTAALAGRGLRVAGTDRFRPPHALGSSHGGSRIIRRAYFEGTAYVPLVERAYRGWRQLEAASGRRLLVETGGLTLGPPHGRLVEGARASAAGHGVAHELLAAAELRRRFPLLRVPAGQAAVYEPGAGVLDPEGAVTACLESARARGAELWLERPVVAWRRRRANGVEVDLEPGPGVTTTHLVLAAGAWAPALLSGADVALAVERVVQHWFEPRPGADLSPPACPVLVWEHEPGRIWYALPDTGSGVKAALHYQGAVTAADSVERRVAAGEVAAVRGLLEGFLPAAAGRHLASEVCLYTNTADLHFVIDRHPSAPGVWIVAACSGHGFKFAPAVAELVARWIVSGRRPPELAPFAARRPAP